MSVLSHYPPGMVQDLGTHLFTAEDIKAFAREFDPQSFHLDDEAAKDSLFGGLCASGWHTGAVWMRKMCDFRDKEIAAIKARGAEPPVFGPSPGLKNLRWLRPVYAGETVRFGCEIKSVRALRSKDGWAVMETRNFGELTDGTPVMEFNSAVLLQI